jgi:lipopolysaccharide export system protein LptA
MKISLCNCRSDNFSRRILAAWTVAWAILFFGSAGVLAADSAKELGTDTTEKIHVSADRLVAKSKANMAEFIGNVHVTQGDTSMRADRIRIYTVKKAQDSGADRPGSESIDRIVASGNVRVNLDDSTAVADEAEYQAQKRIIILSGPNTTVTRGGNSISGSKITLYRDDGRINVDSSGGQRVKAVFVTEERLME